ncbi:MAG: hypothetical protein OQK04_10550 [Kangiellaceae bacterium]|nr:hypothetical protein [Kangiellaceae bacterium]
MATIAFDSSLFDDSNKSKNKLTYFLLCSLVLHLIVVAYFYDFGGPGLSITAPSLDRTINIEFSRSEGQSENISKVVHHLELDKEIVDSKITPTKNQPSENSNSDSINPKGGFRIESTIEKQLKPQKQIEETSTLSPDIVKQPSQSNNLENILQSIRNRELREATISNNQAQSGPYFDPTINQHLSAQEKEHLRLETLAVDRKRMEDNKHYEFNTTGNTSVARINGRCFIVPQNTTTEEDTRIWLPLGNCEIKKKLDFSTKKLDSEFRDGKREY